MKKKFVHQLPDQPYKQSASKNITVECEYDGPRYLLLRINEKTSTVLMAERYSNDEGFLETTIVDDGDEFDFVVLDTNDHPWEAAYITHSYTHGEVADYEETLSTGEKYSYTYPDGTGVIAACHAIEGLKYDKNLKVYTKPKFLVHPINPLDFWQSNANQLAEIERVLAGDLTNFTDERIAEIRSYRDYLATLKTKYNGVDHWKIPSPKYPDLG